MTQAQWKEFQALRKAFKSFCSSYEALNQDKTLLECQSTVAKEASTPEYELKNMVVYNQRFDEISEKSTIKLILIGDNPGKNEQLQSRYLIGQAGKLAESFFTKNAELGINFNSETLILNKSPFHTAKTAMIKKLLKLYSAKVSNTKIFTFFEKSQEFMANLTYNLHELFNCKVFLIGYGELHDKGTFSIYREKIIENYAKNSILGESFFCFQHFSMNRFSIDLKKNFKDTLSLEKNLQILGKEYSKRIFNF